MSWAVTLIVFGQVFLIGARPDSRDGFDGGNLILNSEGQLESAPLTVASDQYKVVCNLGDWGSNPYLPEYVDYTSCTHIQLGPATLDGSSLLIKTNSLSSDLDERFYKQVIAYKQRGLRVLLSLGGWNDSKGDKYSRMVNNSTSRQKFVEHAIRYIEANGFDGLNLDWEWPVCWKGKCNAGPATDKDAFSMLVEELSSVLKPRGLLLSAVVSKTAQHIDTGFDLPVITEYVDWISVVTYDWVSIWTKHTSHNSPLFHHPNITNIYKNAEYSINYLISKGAPPRKIVMGIPFYGKSFTTRGAKNGVGLNAPASVGEAGEFTKRAGTLSYDEICERIRHGNWTSVGDPSHSMGPYAYKGNQWVGFDDADMVSRKAEFIREMNLGGAMVKHLRFDDFDGSCGEGKHPLMQALRQVLRDPPLDHDYQLTN